ncbi:MAG: aminoacetone oxidase family FAD-binding enzyme [Chitinophagales bacterium]
MTTWDIIIVGGGAGGFFTAINYKEQNPDKTILIIEKDKDVLKKVKISGGGRCNVTHACFVPKDLSKFYPRGEKELISPFHQFCTGDMMAWLDERGVATKIEEDNRVFPESNSSQSIIDLFLNEAEKLGVKLNTKTRLDKINKQNGKWHLTCGNEKYVCHKLVMATGSNPKIWQLIAKDLGHNIVEPVPSLFTFNIKNTSLND